MTPDSLNRLPPLLWEDGFLDHSVGRGLAAGSLRSRAQLRLRVVGLEGSVDDRVATALCVLGPLEVVRDGERVRLGSAQQRRVLARVGGPRQRGGVE